MFLRGAIHVCNDSPAASRLKPGRYSPARMAKDLGLAPQIPCHPCHRGHPRVLFRSLRRHPGKPGRYSPPRFAWQVGGGPAALAPRLRRAACGSTRATFGVTRTTLAPLGRHRRHPAAGTSCHPQGVNAVVQAAAHHPENVLPSWCHPSGVTRPSSRFPGPGA